MNNTIHCYRSDGHKSYSLYMPDRVVSMQVSATNCRPPTPVVLRHDASCMAYPSLAGSHLHTSSRLIILSVWR